MLPWQQGDIWIYYQINKINTLYITFRHLKVTSDRQRNRIFSLDICNCFWPLSVIRNNIQSFKMLKFIKKKMLKGDKIVKVEN